MKTIVRMGIEQKRQDSSRDIKCVLEETVMFTMCVWASLLSFALKKLRGHFFLLLNFFLFKEAFGNHCFSLPLSLFPSCASNIQNINYNRNFKNKSRDSKTVEPRKYNWREARAYKKVLLAHLSKWNVSHGKVFAHRKWMHNISFLHFHFIHSSFHKSQELVYDYFFCSPQAKQLQMLLFWQAKADCELNDIIRYVHVPYVPTCTN